MPRYKNISLSVWRRPSGETVAPGASFEATEREQARFVRRGLATRLELATSGPPKKKAPAAASNEYPPPPPSWKLKMDPEVYLRLHEDGPHSDEAREIQLERKRAQEEQDAKE